MPIPNSENSRIAELELPSSVKVILCGTDSAVYGPRNPLAGLKTMLVKRGYLTRLPRFDQNSHGLTQRETIKSSILSLKSATGQMDNQISE